MESGGTWLIVAAHPDDETIGATWLLRHVARVVVVHVTDGAPRNPRLWSARSRRREDYAHLRELEAERALSLAGVGPDRIRRLDFHDQETPLQLVRLSRELQALLEELAPSSVVVQPYEGGHPDHDSCAFAARAAVRLLGARTGAAPRLVEMTGYHRRGGGLVTGEFLPGGPPVVTRVLTGPERSLKRRMLGCFVSQSELLQPFRVDVERYRLAPAYDFTLPPPHAEEHLHYEALGWHLRGDQWRALAEQALHQLRLPPVEAGETAPWSPEGSPAWA